MYSTKKCRKFKEKYKNHKKDVSLKKKSKKNKAKDAHLSYDSKSESNEDIKVDFSEELHPIGYYVKDRAEMINQMFSVIQGKKLRAMLPPLLKGHSVDELKSLCLGELLGMSEKRVMSVLEGRELETSSESDVNTSELEAEEKFAEEDHNENWCSDAEISSTTKTGDNDGTNDGGDMDTLEIGITREEMGELLNVSDIIFNMVFLLKPGNWKFSFISGSARSVMRLFSSCWVNCHGLELETSGMYPGSEAHSNFPYQYRSHILFH